MAQELATILGKTINSTKELRTEINALKDSLINVEQGSEEWQQTATKLTAAQERLSSITQAGKTSIDAAEDSIVGLERQYKSLYNTYKLLSEEQRNSDFGKQMGKSLEDLSSKLNETKKNVGNFKDNIGRYTESVMEGFNNLGISVGGLQAPLNIAKMGVGGLNTAFTALAANPVGAIITAIVLAFKALKAIMDNVKTAINGNEEAQMALSVAMSAFQPILDGISNMWDKVGLAVVKVIEGAANAFRKLRELKAQFTDFIGLTDGAVEAVKEENELYKEIAETQIRITKEKRAQSVLNEEDKARVRELQAEAMATTDQTEKLKKLKESKEILEKVTERSARLAEEELALMKQKAELTANSAADNDAIAAKEKEVNAIRREGASQLKELNSQITSLTKGLSKNTDGVDKNAKAQQELNKKLAEQEKQRAETVYAESVKNSKSKVELLKDEYKEKLELLNKYGKDTIQLTKYYNEKISEAEAAAQKEDIINKRKPIRNQIAQGEITTENNISKAYAESGYTGEVYAYAEEQYRSWLENKATLLNAELSMEFESVEARKEVEAEYWSTKEELRRMDFEKAEQLKELEQQNREMTLGLIDDFSNVSKSVGGLTSTIISLKKAEIDEGNLSEKELKKKQKNLKTLEAIQLAVALAAIAADTASSVMGIWRGYALERVANAQTAAATGPAAAVTLAALNAKSLASAILNTTGIAIAGTTQMAAAAGGYISNVKAINDLGGGGASVSNVTPTQIDTTSYSYTRQLQTEEEEENLNKPIYVLVSDIEEAMKKVEVREEEITF